MLDFRNSVFYSEGELLFGEIKVDGVNVFKNGIPLGDLAFEDKQLIIPGFVDVHVHLREPGFFYKESIHSGTLAAAGAGYTAVCAMPNLNPAPDTLEHLNVQRKIIEETAIIPVYPYGTITKGQNGTELSDMEELAQYVCAFSDDGRGVQTSDVMKSAMLKAKALNKTIVAHCEDNSLLKQGGCVHDGRYAREHKLVGISSESEWKQVERDIELVRETGCKYHVCHISTKESAELIRKAKAEGLPVTAETAPHYLTLTEDDLKDEGLFKMNPPLREEEDRAALIAALNDGTIDVIATDHAPHSDEEKSKGLKDSAFGIVGLETAFPLLYTDLVLTGKVSLIRLIEAMSVNPAKLFGLPSSPTDLAVIDLSTRWTVCGKEMLSKGSATPFEGRTLVSKNEITLLNGDTVWKRQKGN